MPNIALLAFGLPFLAIALTACPGANAVPTADDFADATRVHLSLSPSTLKLDAGKSANVIVSIERPSGLTHEVRLHLFDLPEGVSAPNVVIPADADHVTITLNASDQAHTDQAIAATVTAQTETISSSAPLYIAVRQSGPGGQVNASFTNRDSNADTRPLAMTSAYANFKGSLCQVTASAPGRGIYVCLTAPFTPGKTYRLVGADRVGASGTASITYFQTTTGSSQDDLHAWDSSDGTLTLDAISAQKLEFHTLDTTMSPASGFAGNLASGHFALDLNAVIEDVSNL